MTRFEEQLARMRELSTYGMVSEQNKSNSNYAIEHHATAADGKEYGIIRECKKFYIKVTSPSKGTIAEAYDYIGGITNKKNYQYNSYNDALKNFELKMASINEAHDGKVIVNTMDPFRKEEIIAEQSSKMKDEIARQRQIMYNASMIMNESTCSGVKGEGCKNNMNQPEAHKGKTGDKIEGSEEVKANPEYAGSKKNFDPKSEPFTEKPKAVNEECCDEKTFNAGLPSGAGTGEANTKHNNVPFTDTVNEELETSFDAGVNTTGEGKANTQHNNTPFTDAVNEAFNEMEGDDEELLLDDEDEYDVEEEDFDDEEGGDDIDFEEGESEEFPSSEDGLELDSDIDDVDDDTDLEDRIADLEAQLEDLKSQMGMDETEYEIESDEDFSDEDDFSDEYEDDEDFSDEDEYDEDFSDNEFESEEIEDDDDTFDEYEEEDETESYNESKINLNSIVESVVRELLGEEKTELHDFGKHPGYRKKPMTLPPTGEDKNEHGEDINDESVHSEEPFGSSIGDGFPFNQVVNSVMESIKREMGGTKKKV